MDCETFDSSWLEALYGELDADASAAFDAHLVACPACAARFEKLKATRSLVSGESLVTPAPSNLEARILAAAESAMGAGKVIPLAPKRGVVAFLMRPQLAVAATFLLVIGAAFFLNTAKREAAPATMSAAEPAASQAAAAEPAPMATAAPAPVADNQKAAAAGPSPHAAEGELASAKKLVDTGRCAEALPRLEALAATNADAELYVARCIAQTKGCPAAIARFDSAAKRNAGSENGSRAALEAARCAHQVGQVTAARARYAGLTNDGYVADEATVALANLETPRAAKAAAPKAAAPTKPAAPPPIHETK
jgi:hypothetical protein